MRKSDAERIGLTIETVRKEDQYLINLQIDVVLLLVVLIFPERSEGLLFHQASDFHRM